MQIKGSRALVTGASRGLGKCIVQELLARDARRIYAAAPNIASLQDLVAADGGRVVPLGLDITDDAQVTSAAQTARDVNVVFNNAGVMALGTALDADLNLAERDMRVNYLATLRVTRAFVPVLERQGGGAIVNIISLLGLAPRHGHEPVQRIQGRGALADPGAAPPQRRSIAVVDHPEPELRASTEVLAKVLEVGGCGTDREIARFQYGTAPTADNYLVLGHESLAEVVEVGDGRRGV